MWKTVCSLLRAKQEEITPLLQFFFVKLIQCFSFVIMSWGEHCIELLFRFVLRTWMWYFPDWLWMGKVLMNWRSFEGKMRDTYIHLFCMRKKKLLPICKGILSIIHMGYAKLHVKDWALTLVNEKVEELIRDSIYHTKVISVFHWINQLW